ncbi:DNA adenine methylase [Spirosoma harenae]
MKKLLSPLRYPGGKGVLGKFLANVIDNNGLRGGTYYELYCGGAGAALHLLVNDIVETIVINDADYRIFSFWYSVLHHTGDFIDAIDTCELTVEEWRRFKHIYDNPENEEMFDVGFALFYLNRTSRSGILHASGPIGGYNQTGNYLIGARFYKETLKNRVRQIGDLANRIVIHNAEAEFFIEDLEVTINPQNSFFYLDPPYYHKGDKLYLNNYCHNEHSELAQMLQAKANSNWVVSYDNVQAIREMYQYFRLAAFDLNYSLQQKRKGSELMIFSNPINIPRSLTIHKTEQNLQLLHN